MGSLGTQEAGNSCTSPPDSIMISLDQLGNQLREAKRELGAAHGEIKTMKQSGSLKDRAITELSNELQRMDGRLRTTENYLGSKNLEIQKLSNEKKEALAGQFAAEAALRRVHATQEEEEFFPIEAVISPLQSEIRTYKLEILKLQEDKKVLKQITKSKEAALIEAENILHTALERVLIVENVENQNLELRRQIEICQDENKHLNKVHRQKVVEVEKLTKIIHELKESILAHDATRNVVHDYQRQITELNVEKRTLEAELAKARVSVNRVAAVVVNEWKEESNKVMPVKQWLEDRKCMQAEIHRLQEKLAISERTAKAEAQLKDRLRLRLRTLEEVLKHAPEPSNSQPRCSGLGLENPSQNMQSRRQSTCQTQTSALEKKAFILKQDTWKTIRNVALTRKKKRANGLERNGVSVESLHRKKFPVSNGQICNYIGNENATHAQLSKQVVNATPRGTKISDLITISSCGDMEYRENNHQEDNLNDAVSGFLYDRLQREVIKLKKSLEGKDCLLKAKEDEVKELLLKVNVLTKTKEQQVKKIKREAVARKDVEKLVKPDGSTQIK